MSYLACKLWKHVIRDEVGELYTDRDKMFLELERDSPKLNTICAAIDTYICKARVFGDALIINVSVPSVFLSAMFLLVSGQSSGGIGLTTNNK
nr:hypothetical protein [Tanacetum cinerariifolium]